MNFANVPFMYADIPKGLCHVDTVLGSIFHRRDLFLTFVKKQKLYIPLTNSSKLIIADEFSFHFLLVCFCGCKTLKLAYKFLSFEKSIFKRRYEMMNKDEFENAISIMGFRYFNIKKEEEGELYDKCKTVFDIYGIELHHYNHIWEDLQSNNETKKDFEYYINDDPFAASLLFKDKKGFFLHEGKAYILKQYVIQCIGYYFEKFFWKKVHMLRQKMTFEGQELFLKRIEMMYRIQNGVLLNLSKNVENTLYGTLENGIKLIDQMEKLPPCIHYLLVSIKLKGKIHNLQRAALISYLKKFGMDRDWITHFVETKYNQEGKKEMLNIIDHAYRDNASSYNFNCASMSLHDACPCSMKNFDEHFPNILRNIDRRELVDIEDICSLSKDLTTSPRFICMKFYQKIHGEPLPINFYSPSDYFNTAMKKDNKDIDRNDDVKFSESYLCGEHLPFLDGDQLPFIFDEC